MTNSIMKALVDERDKEKKKEYNLNRGIKNKKNDTCVIRTHAPEGNALAGHRVNHSAKVPIFAGIGYCDPKLWLQVGKFIWVYSRATLSLDHTTNNNGC